MAIASALTLAACATSPATSPATRPAIYVAACPPIVEYSAEQQKALEAALKALPADSPLASAMVDYARLRAAARACRTLAPD